MGTPSSGRTGVPQGAAAACSPLVILDLWALQSAAMGITATSCAAMLMQTGGGERNMNRPRDWSTSGTSELNSCRV